METSRQSGRVRGNRVHGGKRTKENDWYGKDMVLDNEQAKQLVDCAVKKEVYNWDGVEWIVTEALAHGNKVVINADW